MRVVRNARSNIAKLIGNSIQNSKLIIHHSSLYASLLPPPSSPSIHLVILIGLPGSGKSTVASKLMQVSPQRRLISTDGIRSQLFGEESIQGDWLKVWQEVGNQFRQTVQQIAAREVSEAIFDATNAVRKQRREAIALAHAVGFTSITGLWLNPPLGVCLERNERRDRQVPTSVILDMYRSLIGAPPSLEEGLDKLIEVKGHLYGNASAVWSKNRTC